MLENPTSTSQESAVSSHQYPRQQNSFTTTTIYNENKIANTMQLANTREDTSCISWIQRSFHDIREGYLTAFYSSSRNTLNADSEEDEFELAANKLIRNYFEHIRIGFGGMMMSAEENYRLSEQLEYAERQNEALRNELERVIFQHHESEQRSIQKIKKLEWTIQNISGM